MKNRRMGPDTIMNIITGISVISWIIIGVIFIIVAVGNPTSSGMGRPSLKGAGAWTGNAIYGLLVFLIILSISGIFFNMTRMKRKTDKMRLTPIFSGILAIAGIIFLSIK